MSDIKLLHGHDHSINILFHFLIFFFFFKKRKDKIIDFLKINFVDYSAESIYYLAIRKHVR